MPPRRHRVRREHTHSCRFLTFSCYHRLALFNNPAIKNLFVEHLARARLKCGFGLITWVIMPEHIHMVIWPKLPEATVSIALQTLKTTFAKQVIARWRTLAAPILPRITDPRGDLHFWQRGGGHDFNLGAGRKFREKVLYIHYNPVDRKLVKRAVDWQWSSARWYRQPENHVGPPCDPVQLPGSYVQEREWLFSNESTQNPATPPSPTS